MSKYDEWCTGRYATVTLCVKRLLEEGDVPITHNLLSVFWYSFTCFRSSGFETTLNRTMDMTMAYREFYRMVKNIPEHRIQFNDALMFIIKGFPASATVNACVDSDTNTIDTLLRLSQLLIQHVIENYEDYKENPILLHDKARDIYSDVNTSDSEETVLMNG